MAIIVGPSDWWINTAEAINPLAIACPIGTRLPDGSSLISRAGGCAWIVAPSCTQVSSAWAGGQYNTVCVTAATPIGLGKNIACISEWPALNTLLLQCGFNPSDWFIPSSTLLNNPGYVCRTNWDTFTSSPYWSSSESDCLTGTTIAFDTGGGSVGRGKTSSCPVRAFRCVTY
jgi:hypothetical protein